MTSTVNRRSFIARGSNRRGATAVEFALTAPILFAIVLGAIEFSRANMLVHTTAIAATEAARKSIIPGATAEEVRLAALEELRHIGIIDASVYLDPAEILDDTTQVKVSLTVPVSLRNGYGIARIFLGRNVAKSVTLQREGKSEEVQTEVVETDGMRGNQGNNGNGNGNGNNGNGNGNGGGNGNGNGNSGSGGGNGNGNNGNGNGNGGGNGSNGNGNGNGNSGSGNSGSGSGNSGNGNGGSSGTGS